MGRIGDAFERPGRQPQSRAWRVATQPWHRVDIQVVHPHREVDGFEAVIDPADADSVPRDDSTARRHADVGQV